MTNKSLQLSEPLLNYLLEINPQETPSLRRLREETASLPQARMQIAPEQGHFMALLARLLGARRALEIGVFTGYSSLAVAQALPEDGELVACDVSAEWTAIARRYWREAGVEHKIRLELAPALQTLDRLLAEGGASRFDLAFIDADKENDWNYFERALALLRPGGAVLVDNVLWSGRVIDPAAQDADTLAIRDFNARLRDDARVWHCVVPIADGLALAIKKA
jgi:predicted O-methyltransferase YrrM